jgi:NAD(P)-dependent dehydrogenase (short-subunit alcohol dehydrogenase family)
MSPSERELSGRVAIVTGAGVGIGAGIAVALAEAGAAVTVADVDVATAASTSRGIEAKGGRALAVRVDVSDSGQVRGMVERTAEAFGSVDILVNNAGIATTQLVEDLDEDAWRRVLEVNLTGPFLCSKAVLPLMREKGWGRIVNIASVDQLHGGRQLHGLEGRAPRVHPSPRLRGRRARHQRQCHLPRSDAHRHVRAERRRGNPARARLDGPQGPLPHPRRHRPGRGIPLL